MKKSNLLLPLLVAAAVHSATAQADALDYSFVGLQYVSAEIDEVDIDGDGYGVEGSFSLNDNYHIFASYGDLDYDYDVSSTSYDFGLGYSRALTRDMDLVATVSYVSAEVKQETLGSYDDDGYGLGLGIRAMVSEKFELSGGLNYIDLSDSGSDTVVSVGAGFDVTRNIQVGAGISSSDDGTGYNLGVRFYFGR